MKMSAAIAGFVALALSLGLATSAHAQAKQQQSTGKVYRWVDEKGQVHYGDSVPPEFVQQDAEVLNRQGVPVRRIEGAETPDEARLRQQQEDAVKRAAQARQRDRVLLQTYLSVQEIERLRDSRLDVIDSQIVIQQQYMAQLRQKHDRQLKAASVYKPYSTNPAAEPVPAEMAADIERAEADMRTQESNLQKKRAERETLKARFESDIARFKELKGMKPGTLAPLAAPVPAPKPAPPESSRR